MVKQEQNCHSLNTTVLFVLSELLHSELPNPYYKIRRYYMDTLRLCTTVYYNMQDCRYVGVDRKIDVNGGAIALYAEAQ